MFTRKSKKDENQAWKDREKHISATACAIIGHPRDNQTLLYIGHKKDITAFERFWGKYLSGYLW